MRWLKAVIARLTGLLRPATNTASSTPAAGRAHREPTTARGRVTSATGLPPLRPAPTAQSPSKEPARRTRSAPKRGSASKTAPPPQAPLSIVAGSKLAAPASPRRPPASPVAKAKQKPVASTKTASKATPAKAPARTRTVKPSGAPGR